MVVAYTIGRILIPLLFIVDGIRKALTIADFAKALQAGNAPFPEEIVPYLGGMPKYEALGYAIVAIEIICGLMVLIGLKARWGALILVVFTACTIIFVHHFWDMNGEVMTASLMEALKYLSIIGGLLMVVAVGSGPTAMDRRG
jgi:putative oxidoreductase